jgi:hypothetical protein
MSNIMFGPKLKQKNVCIVLLMVNNCGILPFFLTTHKKFEKKRFVFFLKEKNVFAKKTFGEKKPTMSEKCVRGFQKSVVV